MGGRMRTVGSYAAEEVAIACVEACYRGDSQGRAIHMLGPLSGKVLRISPPLVMPVDEAECISRPCTASSPASACE